MEEPQSLRSLFAAAKAQKNALGSRGDTNSETYREEVTGTIAKFLECQRQVSMLSLFSSNELLEDVSTADIQYMTLEYHLAELMQRATSSDRENALKSALEYYEKYLMRLDEYLLLSGGDKKLFEQYMANSTSFTLAPANDAAARREIKVRRFREEKELKQKLEYFAQNEARLQSDDDDTRSLYLAEIQLYTHQTFQALDLLIQELSILSAMRNAPPRPPPTDDPRQRSNIGGLNYSERLDPSTSQLLRGGRGGPLLNSKGKPMQPFTLLGRRSEMQKGVFRPGHNLPTMTIEDYLDEEHRRGGIIEGGGEKSGIKPEVDEDDHDIADQETLKARAWDEFTEANPKGAGNTLNRG
ncbi:uncharacterized protein N7515_010003 [Penicillium bovifimosum]|uniref:Uncharacterized protein n=1 Tax=Penicillium bovifimosum TaxID=126998 RepID=A0A9W9GHM9_9EURO|nr:uncharacterized protein N7515_010003 [Penicillium bovifimosum]KAJ5120615.1 hypothetical protein N7515_010003 [Penicillium bovifimosum]